MPEALILRARRSPFGARHGTFAHRHPAELLAEVFAAVLAESGADPGAVDEVLVGCATPVGAQAANVATAAARAAGGLSGVPASVVSTQDTSSLVALIRAVDAVRSGRCGVALVGGVELMSTVPAGADMSQRGFGLPLSPTPGEAHPPPGPAAERWAQRLGVGRDRLEEVGRRTRRRAQEAQAAGRLAAELLPLTGGDELLRAGEAVDRQRPEGLYSRDGLLTAATVAPMADGAAAALVASPAATRRLGLEPVARVAAAAAVGGDPTAGCGSSPEAARRATALAGVGAAGIRRVELAEPFATDIVHWEISCAGWAELLNPDGGSLALGHPQGATGLGLVARLVRALAALDGGGHGLAACDAADGHGVAVLLEA
ncbi:MAG: beta-ketoacyl synthase N-terminal-like domain-containing protein [bacterium]|nr:beta-ketoacyl synthase N-terminal-like domain-containing protein [bacterium]